MTTESFDDEVVSASMRYEISSILRIASDIQDDRPRVAYLCRLYAFEIAHRKEDPNSSEPGVQEFKASLHQRLQREDGPALAARVKSNDAREVESYYRQYYETYAVTLTEGDQADRAQLSKAYQTAGMLFEVLRAVNKA